MQIAYPYKFAPQSGTAVADDRSHIKQMLELLLFTMPGERVNRPDFGCGVQRIVFAPVGTEIEFTLQRLIESEIQRWLGDLLRLRNLEIRAEEATLFARLEYELIAEGSIVTEQFARTFP
jgi:hypothetical protein